MIPEFVAGDWGTTHLRLYLCAGDGAVLESARGPGAAKARGAHAAILEGLIVPWQRGRAPLTVVLCGMVGSNLGWALAPYVPCPARPIQIVEGCLSLLAGRVLIVPGLSCRNGFAAPDVMRGEETQILGALHLEASLQSGMRLLCLPGTHTKWALLEGGTVREFLTAPAGEIYGLLCEHSVLVGDPGARGSPVDKKAFVAGVRSFKQYPQAQLLHRLFECRSRQLSGEFEARAAAAFLSGLLIASDVCGALAAFPSATSFDVTVIGTPTLTALYGIALKEHGWRSLCLDGAQASLAGLTHLHRQLSTRSRAHDV